MLNRTRIVIFALLTVLVGCSTQSPQHFGELSEMGRGKTDKTDDHKFTEIYEHLFSPLRQSPVRICEIGIFGGGSLRMWTEYFPKGTVFGIDLLNLDELHASMRKYNLPDFLPDKPETDRIKTFEADQSNRNELKRFIDKYGGDFDIVLDDGGHTMEQQQTSFGFFFKYVKPGGYYVIEDVHTSLPEFYKGFGVEENEANSTLNMINYFVRHGRIQSQYLRPDEIEYLNSHIEFVDLFARKNRLRSITCIFQKKNEVPVGLKQ
jgi:demethylmacrocin O-methyltransferase